MKADKLSGSFHIENAVIHIISFGTQTIDLHFAGLQKLLRHFFRNR